MKQTTNTNKQLIDGETKMTLNEFIEELKKLQEEGKGDYQVVVQYRDDGGDYAGWDEDVTPVTKEEKKRIVL